MKQRKNLIKTYLAYLVWVYKSNKKVEKFVKMTNFIRMGVLFDALVENKKHKKDNQKTISISIKIL